MSHTDRRGRKCCNGPPGRLPSPHAHANSLSTESPSTRACLALVPRRIQIGVPLHSTGKGHSESETPWLAGARAAKEVAGRNTFLQIRDSAISNPRIWIVNERQSLGIKGPGKAAGKQSGSCVPSGIIISLSLSSLLSPLPVSLIKLYLRVLHLK